MSKKNLYKISFYTYNNFMKIEHKMIQFQSLIKNHFFAKLRELWCQQSLKNPRDEKIIYPQHWTAKLFVFKRKKGKIAYLQPAEIQLDVIFVKMHKPLPKI